MKSRFLKLYSALLSLVMLLQAVPVTAQGAEDTTDNLQTSSAQTAGEVCVIF